MLLQEQQVQITDCVYYLIYIGLRFVPDFVELCAVSSFHPFLFFFVPLSLFP
jgi:hypothetical protein